MKECVTICLQTNSMLIDIYSMLMRICEFAELENASKTLKAIGKEVSYIKLRPLALSDVEEL